MIRAHVTDDALGLGVRVFLIRHPPEGQGGQRQILRCDSNGHWQAEDADPYVVTEPTFRLDDDMARALLDALTRYYHGAEDTRALRRDYDDERRRVDRLTATLGDVAKALVSEP